MRISELDDIDKEILLGKVVERARADLNDGRPLTEMRRVKRPRVAVRNTWASLSKRSRKHALRYYCNPQMQVHHNCEHGGRDFDYYSKQDSLTTETNSNC